MTARDGVIGLGLGLALGCGATTPRLRLYSSQPTGATWAFVVEDRGHAAELFVDGRPRTSGCERAGVHVRCELRGLFPGGHTLELRLAGGVLKRSALVGTPWPLRPIFVRARDLGTVIGAGHVGADGVLVPDGLEMNAFEELVEAAHKAGVRALVESSASDAVRVSALVERYALDGVVGAAILPAVVARFPETRSFAIDVAASARLAQHQAGAPLPLGDLGHGDGLVEAHGVLGLGLALVAGRGAIIDGAAFPLIGVRRRHKALREGLASALVDDGLHYAVRLSAGGDAVTLVGNAGPEPWSPTLELPPVPIDLLGGPMSAKGPTVPPGELAVILASPDPDRTRY